MVMEPPWVLLMKWSRPVFTTDLPCVRGACTITTRYVHLHLCLHYIPAFAYQNGMDDGMPS